MAYLLDTNILVRLANSADPQHLVASQSILKLHRQSEVLHVTPQVLIEFRNVATRPVSQNGLGLSTVNTEAKTSGFEATFPLLLDSADIYARWKAVVAAFDTIGKQVHDARLVAVCSVHSMSHLPTFNTSDFRRISTYGSGVVVVDPRNV